MHESRKVGKAVHSREADSDWETTLELPRMQELPCALAAADCNLMCAPLALSKMLHTITIDILLRVQ